MLARPLHEIEADASLWRRRLHAGGIDANIIDGFSTIGGGSLPGASLPTKLVAIQHAHVDELAAALRAATNPLIGRIQQDLFLLDPRTVLPEQGELLLEALLSTAPTEHASGHPRG
jgi:L-seryl-tRNA(Ser) seleniumtransferase